MSRATRACSAVAAWLLVACSLLLPRPLMAQYMFLDANGDGRNDSRDRLPHHGWSELEVWINTTSNRDGSAPDWAAGGRSEIAAYELLVAAGGIAVEWGRFTPAEPNMKVVRGPLADSLRYYVGVNCGKPLEPGKHKLGRIRLRPRWGQAALNIIPCGLIGDTVGTSFQARLDGPKRRLGPTVAWTPSPTVARGEWYDADGVSFSHEPLPSAGPVRVESGILYLGWTRMQPPFELRIIEGRAVVNGFAPMERARPTRRPQPSNADKAQFYSDVFSLAVGRTLHELKLPDSVVETSMATAYRLNYAVDSVAVGAHGLSVFRRGATGARSYEEVELPRWVDHPRPWVEPESNMAHNLEEWARALRSGYMLRIMGVGRFMVDPTGERIDRAIGALQRGKLLSPEDSAAVLGVEPTVSKWDAIAHPEPLERARR